MEISRTDNFTLFNWTMRGLKTKGLGAMDVFSRLENAIIASAPIDASLAPLPNRTLFDRFDLKALVKELLSAILAQEALLATCAATSYAHNNGYDKLVLLAPSHSAFEARLHIWWPKKRTELFESIHNHPWNFSTAIITGGYHCEIFGPDIVGNDYFHYRLVSTTDADEAVFVGRRSAAILFQTTCNAGDCYSQHHSLFHRVVPIEGELTSTLHVRQAFVGRTTHLLTARPLNREKSNPIRFMTKQIFKETALKYLDAIKCL